jgi:hypothetical protein
VGSPIIVLGTSGLRDLWCSHRDDVAVVLIYAVLPLSSICLMTHFSHELILYLVIATLPLPSWCCKCKQRIISYTYNCHSNLRYTPGIYTRKGQLAFYAAAYMISLPSCISNLEDASLFRSINTLKTLKEIAVDHCRL